MALHRFLLLQLFDPLPIAVVHQVHQLTLSLLQGPQLQDLLVSLVDHCLQLPVDRHHVQTPLLPQAVVVLPQTKAQASSL